MIGRKEPSRLKKDSRLAVSFLILLLTGLSGRAAAQEIRIERVGVSAPVGGAAAAAPGGASLAGASVSLSANHAQIAVSFASPLDVAPSAVMPAAVPAVSAETPLFVAAKVARTQVPSSRLAVQETSRRTSAGAVAGPVLEAAAVTAAGVEGPRSSEMDRDGAARDFSAFLGERLSEGKGEVPASVAVAAKPTSVSPRLGAPTRAGARFIVGVPAVLALALHPSFHAVLYPSLTTWNALSQVGYVAGNVGSAIFPLFQIYDTFHGKSTPKGRAIMGAAASLALGLISAPILHKSLWGVQNVFGGLTLLVPLVIGGLAGRVQGSGLKETALIAAAALAVSVGVYFAVAAMLPGFLAAAFSAAAVAKISLVVQLATSAMFLGMFLPDVVKVMRGRAAGGFSPGFNLMFLLSAVGSMVWALPSAWIIGDAQQNAYRLIFGVNAIYALASFLSFWFARRAAKPN